MFKLKTEALLRVVYDRAAEAFMCQELIKPKLDLLKSLRKKLKGSSGFTFPDNLLYLMKNQNLQLNIIIGNQKIILVTDYQSSGSNYKE